MKRNLLAMVLVVGALVLTGCSTDDLVFTGGSGPNEGAIGAPVTITVGTPHSGYVAGLTLPYTSYYTFTTGGTPPTNISTTATSANSTDLMWALYSDSGYTAAVTACDFSAGVGEIESCGITVSASTPYWLLVYNFALGDTAYTLLVN